MCHNEPQLLLQPLETLRYNKYLPILLRLQEKLDYKNRNQEFQCLYHKTDHLVEEYY